MKNEILSFALFILVSIASQSVLAADRHIHVNGEHLSPEYITIMDQLWGYTVPNGFYWLDDQTGEWGYENSDRVEGVIQAIVNYNQQQQYASNQAGETYINSSQNGSVVSGNINGQNCTYASAGGYTVRHCD